MLSCCGKLVKNRQKNRPFQLKNKRSAGGNSLDNSRDGFSGGAQRGLARAGAGAELGSGVPLELGSNFVVKLHQIRTKSQIRARNARFCLGNYGFAEQNPSVFLGGIGIFGRAEARFFIF